MTRRVGRPTKYKREYCDKIIEFFGCSHYFINKQGKKEANSLPTFERFADDIKVNIDTLHEWKKKHVEFSEAYRLAKSLQRDMINNLALLGLYNAGYAMFFVKNCLRF